MVEHDACHELPKLFVNEDKHIVRKALIMRAFNFSLQDVESLSILEIQKWYAMSLYIINTIDLAPFKQKK